MAKPERVLFCGSRDWRVAFLVWKAVRELPPDATVVHGDARGVDRLAAAYAERRGLQVEAHPADWRRWGAAAGPIRNREMLESGVDRAVAFHAADSRGTADMVRQLQQAGVPVEVFTDAEA